MRYLVGILLIGLYACQSITAQHPSPTLKEDVEFEKLLSQVAKNNDASIAVQVNASKTQTAIVGETVSKIVTLKTEVVDLKTDLNEVKAKLDSVNVDTGRKFILLPISDH